MRDLLEIHAENRWKTPHVFNQKVNNELLVQDARLMAAFDSALNASYNQALLSY
ncbi:hypothetical protein [Asaia bogorensis]|uniref:hypothetical protein n=1 Tax=Asaia bogorensis TaxID=91915 RepID=UPI0030198915